MDDIIENLLNARVRELILNPDALKIDKRTYLQYYLSLIKTKHPFIFPFCQKKDYNVSNLISFFEEVEFNSFIKKIKTESNDTKDNSIDILDYQKVDENTSDHIYWTTATGGGSGPKTSCLKMLLLTSLILMLSKRNPITFHATSLMTLLK